MGKPTLIENFKAGAVVAPYRICMPGSDDDHAVQAAAATSGMFGVSDSLGADAAEGRVDIVTAGVAEVEYGGAVTRGAPLTSDASGRAVAAASGNRVIGIARVSGVSGDIGLAQLAPGVY